MEAIINEFIHYLRNFVEKPNKLFSNLPVCPFAKQARLDNRIKFCICDLNDIPKDKIPLLSKESVLWFIHPEKDFDQLKLEEISVNLSKEFTTFDFFTGHPESQIFYRREPHPNILVQNVDFLNEKRAILKKTKYYEYMSITSDVEKSIKSNTSNFSQNESNGTSE
jgi:hypothetical protein